MGYPEQVGVDPAALRVVAAEVDTAASTLTAAAASSRGRLAPAGQDGWAAAAAARSAQTAWEGFLTRLAGSVAGLSADLSTAAQSYTVSDQAAAGRVHGGRMPQ